MNVYQMYYKNGKRLPFYIRRDTWGDTVAKVHSIKGVVEGDDLPGYPPYYNNPDFYADFIKISTAEIVGKDQKVSCPGTYSYSMCDIDGNPMEVDLFVKVRRSSLSSIDRRCQELEVGVEGYIRLLIQGDIGIDVSPEGSQ